MHLRIDISISEFSLDCTDNKTLSYSGGRNRYFYFRISQNCWRGKSTCWRMWRFIVKGIQITGLSCCRLWL